MGRARIQEGSKKETLLAKYAGKTQTAWEAGNNATSTGNSRKRKAPKFASPEASNGEVQEKSKHVDVVDELNAEVKHKVSETKLEILTESSLNSGRRKQKDTESKDSRSKRQARKRELIEETLQSLLQPSTSSNDSNTKSSKRQLPATNSGEQETNEEPPPPPPLIAVPDDSPRAQQDASGIAKGMVAPPTLSWTLEEALARRETDDAVQRTKAKYQKKLMNIERQAALDSNPPMLPQSTIAIFDWTLEMAMDRHKLSYKKPSSEEFKERERVRHRKRRAKVKDYPQEPPPAVLLGMPDKKTNDASNSTTTKISTQQINSEKGSAASTKTSTTVKKESAPPLKKQRVKKARKNNANPVSTRTTRSRSVKNT
eukprot:m.52071 g.52071  ORF g.52071 m.52071 type:complete len:371 (+) comp10772_c0_seq1:526-1638(+)